MKRLVFILGCFGIILAVAGLVIVIVWPFGDGGTLAASPSVSGTASSTPVPSALPAAAVPDSPPQLSVTCSGPPTFARGQSITVTYVMDVTVAGTASLGAELYDSVGNDHSVGIGDASAVVLTVGRHSVSRQITIPRDLAAGAYELNAEIWPANKIGTEMTDVDSLADASCGTTTLP
jgi:hypothetical protein